MLEQQGWKLEVNQKYKITLSFSIDHSGRSADRAGLLRFHCTGHATEKDVSRVNRSISIAAGLPVGDVYTVNGDIRLSEIVRNIETISGEILLENSRIGRDLERAKGDVTLLQGATIEGDIIIAAQRGWCNKFFSGNSRPLKLVIDEKPSVNGRIHLYREVELHIDPAADVGELIEHC